MTTRTFCLCLFLLAGACQQPSKNAPDPTQREVPLTARAGWNASLVYDNNDTGVWTVKAFDIFPQYATPEVVALDDDGRCIVLVSYSGKWTPHETVHDGAWLGGLDHGDVDPRIEGAELYTGGKKGNLYQVVAYPHGALDHRLIAHLPGREIHTIVALEEADGIGPELLVFTRPGALYRMTPDGPHGTWQSQHLTDLEGRVRDAVVVKGRSGLPELFTVGRHGRLEHWRLDRSRPELTLIHETNMGMGRLASRYEDAGLLVHTLDDGQVLAHLQDPVTEAGRRSGWSNERLFAGSQGPRGIALGRFHADPDQLSFAVFGYGEKVELVTWSGAPRVVETIFVDRDKGHWLSAAELDGRNATDELLLSGYGGRVVLLARPPGFGIE